MSKRIEAAEQERLLDRLEAVLDQAQRGQQLLTYLQVADLLAVDGPHRIHKTTGLLEILLKRDAEARHPIRAALAVSRARCGRPAPGFFDRARRLGLLIDENENDFHDRLLAELQVQ